jgi:hypothetical protein
MASVGGSCGGRGGGARRATVARGSSPRLITFAPAHDTAAAAESAVVDLVHYNGRVFTITSTRRAPLSAHTCGA